MLFNLLENTGTAQPTESNNLATVIIMIVLIVAIIALFVWQTINGKKKQKEAQEMVNTLKVGDRVKTIGGICGFVAEINDAENTFVLETGTETKKSYVKFDKGAIYQTAPAQGNAVAAPVAEEAKKPEAEKNEVVEKAPAKKKTAKKTTAKAEVKEDAEVKAEAEEKTEE